MKGCSRGMRESAADEHLARLGEVERDDGNFFEMDVVPDVELGPVGEREDANAFAGADAAVEEVPQLGALVFGVPLAGGVAEGEDALLGAGFFFVAARSAEGCVEAVGAEAVEQGRGFEQSAAALGAELDGIGSVGEGFFVAPDDELEAEFGGVAVAEFEHLAELVAGVDVKEREGNGRGVEGLLREAQHDGGVFADGVEHHRVLELGGDLAEDVDALGLEELNVAQALFVADLVWELARSGIGFDARRRRWLSCFSRDGCLRAIKNPRLQESCGAGYGEFR